MSGVNIATHGIISRVITRVFVPAEIEIDVEITEIVIDIEAQPEIIINVEVE